MADNTVISIDFTGAPPTNETGMSARVDPGTYRLKVADASHRQVRNDKTMITVTFKIAAGKYVGRQIKDTFVLPRPGTDDSRLGLQRFHAMLVAITGKEVSGNAKLDLATLKTKELVADLDDDVIPARDQYKETIVSKPVVYHAKGKTPSAAPAASTNGVGTQEQAAATEPAAAPAAVSEAEEPASPEPVAATAGSDEEDLDSLFDE